MRIIPIILIAPLLLALSGCGGGVDATDASVGTAEAKWKAANIRDYDLEWANSGMGTGHYKVFVRGGEVKAIYSVIPGGREVVAKPGAPRLYSVDGLFTVIKDEMAQRGLDQPFGQPKGTSAVLKFTPDPELGYPRSYRRDVMGTPKGVSIDVLRLDRNPPAEIPPPAGAAASVSR
jgi:hypothetical protein